MKSERSVRGLACRWCAVVVLATLGSLLSASVAQAQVQTFFVNVPAASEQRDAMELCRDRFTAALVRVGGFRANQDAVTQQSVTDCLGEMASATAKRECEVSMANIEVDFLILPVARRLGQEWNWGIKALSPAQGAAQVWGGDQRRSEADLAEAAYIACDELARDFACAQGVSSACVGSGFGAGPLLTNSTLGAGGTSPAVPVRARVAVSALDVFDVTPTEVAVWIFGKELGTSANQVTGIPPGEHEVTLKATGYSDWSQRVSFVAGKPAVLKGIRLRKTTASLRVTMAHPGNASVLVGGRERGLAGGSLAGIAPGATDVVIRAPGYRERREQVTFVADEEAKLEGVTLAPMPATLTVKAKIMGAEVLVDGRLVGETTGADDTFEVAPSAKRIEVRREGYDTFARELDLEPGGRASIEVPLERIQTPRNNNASSECPSGFVRIEPGTFTMGSPTSEPGRTDEEIQHRVTITRPFCLQATEVTQGQWRATMNTRPSFFSDCGDNCPVERVNWFDAVAFANARSRSEGLQQCYTLSGCTGVPGSGNVTGEKAPLWGTGDYVCSSVRVLGPECLGYRLATESERQYAARGGTTGALYTGNLTIRGQMNGPEIDPIAWYGGNSGVTYRSGVNCSDWLEKQHRSTKCGTHPVGQKQPNPWGLYDMLGNVDEWTGDWEASYPGAVTDPVGPASGARRMRPGGSWCNYARRLRAASRNRSDPSVRGNDLGIRLARTLPSTSSAGSSPTESVKRSTLGCPDGFVRIEPGTFTMGSPTGEQDRDDDEVQQTVAISRGYCMKATEVTQREWQSVMGSNPSNFKNCGWNCPVEQVSWEDAVGYANALSRREGLPECYAGSTFPGLTCRGYRLPTEAEWEYAARAGTTGATYGNLDSVAWYDENSGSATHPVGQKQPNAWGLYDMLGNVWEWTGDWYDTYPGTVTDPTGPATGSARVLRGGSWGHSARDARAAYRGATTPGYRSGSLGFRLVRTAVPVAAPSGGRAVLPSFKPGDTFDPYAE
jgi:formylglycine-generating enzyme required for sulfatase activity